MMTRALLVAELNRPFVGLNCLTKDDEAAIQEFYGADAGVAREALSLYRSEAATNGADGSRGIEFMRPRYMHGSRALRSSLDAC
jgi:hypothetical protein